jgi:hypothetical protein
LVAELGAALDTLLAATVESGDGQLDNTDALRALGYFDVATPPAKPRDP